MGELKGVSKIKKIIMIMFLFFMILFNFGIYPRISPGALGSFQATRHSGDYIDATYGINPTIDGAISNREWLDAGSITYNNHYGEVTVYFKHNNQGLLVAFDIPDTSYPDFDDSGVALDINHDGVASDNDYFLELNRNGRYDTRTGTDYRNHDTSSPVGWEAMYTTSDAGWQVEYNISFELLDITPGESKTLGIAFHTLDQTNGEFDWPTSCHILHPDTFSDLAASDDWKGVLRNLAPFLSSGAVSPITGDTATEFTFSVKYYDLNGDVPIDGNVIIDGICYDISPREGENPSDGIYEYTTKLTAGEHKFYFEFNDDEFEVKLPATREYEGPTVNKEIENGGGWRIPSFELIIVICAIGISSILKRKKKNR